MGVTVTLQIVLLSLHSHSYITHVDVVRSRKYPALERCNNNNNNNAYVSLLHAIVLRFFALN